VKIAQAQISTIINKVNRKSIRVFRARGTELTIMMMVGRRISRRRREMLILVSIRRYRGIWILRCGNMLMSFRSL